MEWGQSMAAMQLCLQLVSTSVECAVAVANDTYLENFRTEYTQCMTKPHDPAMEVFLHNEHRITYPPYAHTR